MRTFFLILKFWFITLIIIFPIVLALCKSAKLGDKGNKFVDNNDGNI